MIRLSNYAAVTSLCLFCFPHLGAAAPAVTPAQEQAAIKQVREQVPKNREAILRKSLRDWETINDSVSMLGQSLAALRLNIDIEKANELIQKQAATHPVRNTESNYYGIQPVYAQIYYLFNSESPFFPGRLTPKTEAVMKEQMWLFLNPASKVDFISPTEDLQIISTENIDLRSKGSFYLFSAVLKDDPAYRDRKLDDGHTTAEHYAALNAFYKRHLKARALNGIWFEVGSSQYAKHTWPVMLVLADVAPDETVRRYARMLLDLAWVENAELSFGFTRLGGVVRGEPNGPYVSMFAPLLFGEEAQGSVLTVAWAASDYQVPDIAILLNRFGSNEPPCEIINKIPSFVHAVTADGKYETGHEGGPLLNYIYKTPRYALGGLMINPAERVSAIHTDRRWQGLIFNDAEKTGIALLEPKVKFQNFWHVQYKNVMVGQKAKIAAIISAGPEIEEVDDWVFVKRGDAFAAVRAAYGGYKLETAPTKVVAKVAPEASMPSLDDVAPGGKKVGEADNVNEELNQLGLAPSAVPPPAPTEVNPKMASNKGGVVRFNDEWAPIILHAGDVEEFGSYEKFKEKILKAELKVTDDAVIYKGPGQPAITFYHKQLNETVKAGEPGSAAKLKMPEIDGKPVNLRPALTYQSPFLSSVPGAEKVRTAFGSYVKEYDFGK